MSNAVGTDSGVYIALRNRGFYIYMCVYICLYIGAAGAGAVVGSGDGGALAFVGVYVHIQTEISVYV